ncbi:hypothetical protein [Sandaracinus amylolyticus]|uniref:Uncharacterized protein n=1 Tax=Sandaracinus amylolyticus TaxID=927083 RepID=A0A0F6SDS2_9BACT|nr:hypothetical protein [Sandaracinus amylolyticus]AKF03939.1 hypothetical protein DB32_001088 [Sandaracinus amylolyticus]
MKDRDLITSGRASFEPDAATRGRMRARVDAAIAASAVAAAASDVAANQAVGSAAGAGTVAVTGAATPAAVASGKGVLAIVLLGLAGIVLAVVGVATRGTDVRTSSAAPAVTVEIPSAREGGHDATALETPSISEPVIAPPVLVEPRARPPRTTRARPRGRDVDASSASAPAPSAVPPSVTPRAIEDAPRAPRDDDPLALAPSTPPADDPLARELALVRRATDALRAGDATGALRALDEHARDHTHGALAQEREVLRVIALCERGLDARATEVATRLLAQGDAAHAERIRRSCARAALDAR